MTKIAAGKYQDISSQEGSYDAAAQFFLSCQPDEWCRTANAITLLGLPKLIVTRQQITAAILHLIDQDSPDSTGSPNNFVVQKRIKAAEIWLNLILGSVERIDLSSRREEVQMAAEMFFRESSSCICRTCYRATERTDHTEKSQARPVMQRGRIFQVLQSWNKLERYCAEDWL